MANIPNRKQGAINVTQTPGGNQSFSLFSDASASPQHAKSSISVHPQGNSVSANSPFSQGAAPSTPQKSSIAVSSRSNPNRPDIHSPFSSEPMPQQNRPLPQANVQSRDNPFGADPSQPVQYHQAGYVPKANIPSQQSPFSSAPAEQYQANYVPKANIPSQESPFSASEGPVSPRQRNFQPKANVMSNESPFSGAPASEASGHQRRSSIGVQQTPGGNQNINLFADAPPIQPSTTTTPTYGYAADSPFNKNPNMVSPTQTTRKESRANLPSSTNPFNAQGTNPAPYQATFVPKANIPSNQSPFSTAPVPQHASNRDGANRESYNSPFSSGAPNTTAPPQVTRTGSVRAQQTPGGNQNFSLFGDTGYGNPM